MGLDHTAVLGNTIEEIARNKAGIYKSSVEALSVKQDYQEGEKVLKEYAESVGVSVSRCSVIVVWTQKCVLLSLGVRHPLRSFLRYLRLHLVYPVLTNESTLL